MKGLEPVTQVMEQGEQETSQPGSGASPPADAAERPDAGNAPAAGGKLRCLRPSSLAVPAFLAAWTLVQVMLGVRLLSPGAEGEPLLPSTLSSVTESAAGAVAGAASAAGRAVTGAAATVGRGATKVVHAVASAAKGIVGGIDAAVHRAGTAVADGAGRIAPPPAPPPAAARPVAPPVVPPPAMPPAPPPVPPPAPPPAAAPAKPAQTAPAGPARPTPAAVPAVAAAPRTEADPFDTAPVVTAPENGQTIGPSVIVAGRGQPGANLLIAASDEAGAVQLMEAVAGSGGAFMSAVDLGFLQDGPVTIRVVVRDAGGNWSAAAPIRLKKVAKPPWVPLVAQPEHGSVVGAHVYLEGVAWAGGLVKVTATDRTGRAVTREGVTPLPWGEFQAALDLMPLANGTVTFRVRAADAAGRWSEPVRITVTKANIP